jgi:hypothetical protein
MIVLYGTNPRNPVSCQKCPLFLKCIKTITCGCPVYF